MRSKLWVLIGVLLVAVVPAAAQSGGLSVCVNDASNAPLPGVTVTLSNDKQFTPTTSQLTRQDGCVDFPVLRSGSGYALLISMPGYADYRVEALRVNSGQNNPQTVSLTENLTERVEVSGRSSVVDLDQTGTSTKFDQAFIENLPVPGRFYQNILTLAPGVQDSDGDGNPNVHGARERNFRAVVDGVANTDPLTGEWLSLLNTDAIEEMEVVGTGAGVEYGRASGGFARIIQKQGSNDFEGLFSMVWRSSKLDGGAPGDVIASPESAKFEWYQPALQLSGPIVKDRLWYRASHEYIDREDPIATINGIATTTRTQSIASDQLTWQLSPRNKLSFGFQADPTTIENFGVSSRVPAASSQRIERGGPTYKVNWSAPISPRLLVESTLAYQDLERGFFPMSEDSPNRCAIFGAIDGQFTALNTARCFDSRTGLFSGGHNEIWEDRRQRLTVSAQATWFVNRFLGSSHRIKFGFASENERYFRSLDRGPSINFDVERNPFIGDIGHSFVRVAAPALAVNSARGNNWAVYAEDQFKPLDNLAITLGVRLDREEIYSRGEAPFDPATEAANFEFTILSQPFISLPFLVTRSFTGFPDLAGFGAALALELDANENQIQFGSTAQSAFWSRHRRAEDLAIVNNNFSPRLSIAWDPWGDSKTKIAVTVGRYYDKIFLAIPLIELEPPKAELEFVSLQGQGQFLNVGLAPGFSPAASVSTVDRDLRTPYQDEFTFSIERTIASETSVRATYIRRKYRDQIQDIDINHAVGDKGVCTPFVAVGSNTVVASPGEGFNVVDPETGEVYVDTDRGIGDGRPDDCTGALLRIGGILGQQIERPDGLADLYVLNPGWGEILEVGNNNSTDYTGFVLEIVRRLYRDWQMSASYTWSEAVGDAEDFDQILGNERNLFEQERGFLSFDQTHVVKFNAMKITRFGLRLGGVVRWESGLPFSVVQSQQTIWARSPLYSGIGETARDFRFRFPSGARNDLRNQSYWTLDLRLARDFRIDRVNLQLTAEVFNLFDDKTLIVIDRIDDTIGGNMRFGRQFQIGMKIGF